MNTACTTPTRQAPSHPSPRMALVDRHTFILQQCRGKRVLHVGCADWPFTEELYDAGQLLHQQLENVCAALAGTDISSDAVAFLRDRGVADVFCTETPDSGDIHRRLGWTPEIILAGEVLEHVDEPGPLLRAYGCHMPEGCTLLVTVPNAFSIKGLLHVMLGHEKVNSDHVAYYSHATMTQLLSRCGLELLDVHGYRARSATLVERGVDVLLSPLLLVRPFLCDGLIVRCGQRSRTRIDTRGRATRPL